MDKTTRNYIKNYILEIATITSILFFAGYMVALFCVTFMDKWQIPATDHGRQVLFRTITGTAVFFVLSVILWIARAKNRKGIRRIR